MRTIGIDLAMTGPHKAVVMDKGVWHDVFALSDQALIKIAEN